MFNRWLDECRQSHERVREDVQILAAEFSKNAYYEAQRRAARSRFSGDADGFMHWAKVASEIALISSNAEMELNVVERIVEEKRARVEGAVGQ
jgi:hypothetical protein